MSGCESRTQISAHTEKNTHFLGSLRLISVGHRPMKWAFNKYVIAQSFCHSVDPTLHSQHRCTFSLTPSDISLALGAASFIDSALGVKWGLQAYRAWFFMYTNLRALIVAFYHQGKPWVERLGLGRGGRAVRTRGERTRCEVMKNLRRCQVTGKKINK